MELLDGKVKIWATIEWEPRQEIKIWNRSLFIGLFSIFSNPFLTRFCLCTLETLTKPTRSTLEPLVAWIAGWHSLSYPPILIKCLNQPWKGKTINLRSRFPTVKWLHWPKKLAYVIMLGISMLKRGLLIFDFFPFFQGC